MSDFTFSPSHIAKLRTRVIEEHAYIATADDSDWSRLGKVDAQLNAFEPCEVAIIGLGLGVLPRLMAHYHHLTIFELEPEVVDHFKENYPWVKPDRIVIGDYEETLPQMERLWNYIVYDLGGSAPAWLSQYGQVIVSA